MKSNMLVRKNYNNISFEQHLILGIFIRFVLIIYGEIQDQISEVPYTDIDYKVVTDGARHVLQHESPFKRHTFRYSPLLAYFLIPNLLLHNCFGKLLFTLFDIGVGLLIERIIYNELKTTFFETAEAILEKSRNDKERKDKMKKLQVPERYHNWAKNAALFWVYNPLSMIIATRGNGDSISSFFILATIYFVQKFGRTTRDCFLAGICYGIAIHLRMYPIIFSVAFFLSLSSVNFFQYPNSFWRRVMHIIGLLITNINTKQISFILGTILSLGFLTSIFYHLYGDEYIYEAYLYHFTRKDIRHNFSLYFLMQYLSGQIDFNIWIKISIILPRLIILLYLSITFGSNRKTLSFCLFTQAFVMVTYNPVVTSQYFVWYLALLPLCMKNLRRITLRLAATYFCMWLLAQGLWLIPAYLLEFKNLNTFNFIGIQSVCFFFVNIFILQRLIFNFDVFSNVK